MSSASKDSFVSSFLICNSFYFLSPIIMPWLGLPLSGSDEYVFLPYFLSIVEDIHSLILYLLLTFSTDL